MKLKDIRKRLGSSRNKNFCILMLFALLSASLVVNSELFSTERLDPEDETATTTSPSNYTTTTPESDLDQYIIRFQFVWDPYLPDSEKCNLEFFAYDTDGVTMLDSAAFAKVAENVWYLGEEGYVFTEGDQVQIQMESYQTWHDMTEWVTLTVGPTSHFITFYWYRYGFSMMYENELRINWELI